MMTKEEMISILSSINNYDSAKRVKYIIAEEYKRYLTEKYQEMKLFIDKLDTDSLKNITEEKIQAVYTLKDNQLFKVLLNVVDTIIYSSINFAMLKNGVVIAYIFDHEQQGTAKLTLNASEKNFFSNLLDIVDRIIDNIKHDS